MRAPWIWRQKQAQTPSTRESSMRCQPMCGRLNLRDFETGRGGGRAAFTRRGSGEPRRSTGIHAWLERVFVRIKVNFRAVHYLWRAASFRAAMHAPQAAPPPRDLGGGAGTVTQQRRDASPRPPERMARQTPPCHPHSLPAGRHRDTRVGSRPNTHGDTFSQFPSGGAPLPDPMPV